MRLRRAMLETKATGQVEIYGLMAEFDTPESLLAAAERARQAGYREMDAYTPLPIEGLAEAIGFRRTLIEKIVFTAGLLGRPAGSCCAGG